MSRGGIAILMIVAASAAEPVAAQTGPQERPDRLGGLYVWIDGAYQSIRVPKIENLGVQGLLPATTNLSGSEKHDLRLNGYGMTGGLGYAFPQGTFPSSWGSNVRFELGGDYVRGDGTSISESARVTDVNLTALSLTGQAFGIAGCGGATCFTSSTLSSEYRARNIDLRGKSDFKSGQWTISPSLALIAGSADTDQYFSQQTFSGGALYPLLNYEMNVALKWRDLGAKLGLETVYDFGNGLSAGLTGLVGLAYRSSSMSADASVLFGSTLPRLSAVEDSRDTVPVLANLEARVMARLTPTMMAKAFAGLNYDSDVPGMQAPQNLTFPSAGVPAHIKFDPTTSYYAGVGLTITFGQ